MKRILKSLQKALLVGAALVVDKQSKESSVE